MLEQLQKLGLSAKESALYLAALELGPGTAQELAQKTGLRRPTVYFTIEQLKKRGLMSSFEKGKKTFFAAESPQNLETLLNAERKTIEEGERVLTSLLPQLSGMFDATGERPRVRFFEGKEGLKAMQEDFLRTRDKKIENFFSYDNVTSVFTLEEQSAYRKRRVAKKITGRGIYTRKEGPLKEGIEMADIRWVPADTFSFSSDIVIYGSKVAMTSLKGKLMGVIIESKEIAETMRGIFELAWEGAAQYL